MSISDNEGFGQKYIAKFTVELFIKILNTIEFKYCELLEEKSLEVNIEIPYILDLLEQERYEQVLSKCSYTIGGDDGCYESSLISAFRYHCYLGMGQISDIEDIKKFVVKKKEFLGLEKDENLTCLDVISTAELDVDLLYATITSMISDLPESSSTPFVDLHIRLLMLVGKQGECLQRLIDVLSKEEERQNFFNTTSDVIMLLLDTDRNNDRLDFVELLVTFNLEVIDAFYKEDFCENLRKYSTVKLSNMLEKEGTSVKFIGEKVLNKLEFYGKGLNEPGNIDNYQKIQHLADLLYDSKIIYLLDIDNILKYLAPYDEEATDAQKTTQKELLRCRGDRHMQKEILGPKAKRNFMHDYLGGISDTILTKLMNKVTETPTVIDVEHMRNLFNNKQYNELLAIAISYLDHQVKTDIERTLINYTKYRCYSELGDKEMVEQTRELMTREGEYNELNVLDDSEVIDILPLVPFVEEDLSQQLYYADELFHDIGTGESNLPVDHSYIKLLRVLSKTNLSDKGLKRNVKFIDNLIRENQNRSYIPIDISRFKMELVLHAFEKAVEKLVHDLSKTKNINKYKENTEDVAKAIVEIDEDTVNINSLVMFTMRVIRSFPTEKFCQDLGLFTAKKIEQSKRSVSNVSEEDRFGHVVDGGIDEFSFNSLNFMKKEIESFMVENEQSNTKEDYKKFQEALKLLISSEDVESRMAFIKQHAKNLHESSTLTTNPSIDGPETKLFENEGKLASNLLKYCQEVNLHFEEKEEFLFQCGEIFEQMGDLYLQKLSELSFMKQKLCFIRCSALLNCAKVRYQIACSKEKYMGEKAENNISRVEKSLNFLGELITSEGAKCCKYIHSSTIDILALSKTILERHILQMRTENEKRLLNIQKVECIFSKDLQMEQEIDKILSVKARMYKISERFTNAMADIGLNCENYLGKAPCKYSLVGLGSLARKEITPFSDFEHVIVLEENIDRHIDYDSIIEYFRWFTVLFQMVIINFGETFIKSVGVKSINDLTSSDATKNWFYDSYTPVGIAFDGMVRHASMNPLGAQEPTKNKRHIVELIKPVKQMALYLSRQEELKNGYFISEILGRICYVGGDKALYNVFERKIVEALKQPGEADTDAILRDFGQHFNIRSDILPGQMALLSNNANQSVRGTKFVVKGKHRSFSIKHDLYRPTITALAVLAKIYKISSPSSLDIVDELHEKHVLSPGIAHDFRYLVAVVCELRLKCYSQSKSERDDKMSTDEIFSILGRSSALDISNIFNFLLFYAQNVEIMKLYKGENVRSHDLLDKIDLLSSSVEFEDEFESKSKELLKELGPVGTWTYKDAFTRSIIRFDSFHLNDVENQRLKIYSLRLLWVFTRLAEIILKRIETNCSFVDCEDAFEITIKAIYLVNFNAKSKRLPYLKSFKFVQNVCQLLLRLLTNILLYLHSKYDEVYEWTNKPVLQGIPEKITRIVLTIADGKKLSYFGSHQLAANKYAEAKELLDTALKTKDVYEDEGGHNLLNYELYFQYVMLSQFNKAYKVIEKCETPIQYNILKNVMTLDNCKKGIEQFLKHLKSEIDCFNNITNNSHLNFVFLLVDAFTSYIKFISQNLSNTDCKHIVLLPEVEKNRTNGMFSIADFKHALDNYIYMLTQAELFEEVQKVLLWFYPTLFFCDLKSQRKLENLLKSSTSTFNNFTKKELPFEFDQLSVGFETLERPLSLRTFIGTLSKFVRSYYKADLACGMKDTIEMAFTVIDSFTAADVKLNLPIVKSQYESTENIEYESNVQTNVEVGQNSFNFYQNTLSFLLSRCERTDVISILIKQLVERLITLLIVRNEYGQVLMVLDQAIGDCCCKKKQFATVFLDSLS